MAFRIQKAIVRGEITNEVPGVVTGRIWIVGRNEPLVLQLEGNCLRDLAGCSLNIVNPSPEPEKLTGLRTEQSGTAGTMTASRKTRISTVDEDELLRLLGTGQPVPSRYTNCLYLEWFSKANGRVVIESDSCQLTVSEPRWILPDPESEQANTALDPLIDAALNAPLYSLSFDDDDCEAFDDDDEDSEDDDFENFLEGDLGDDPFVDEEPLDEFDWELELREAERRAGAYGQGSSDHHGSPKSAAESASNHVRDGGGERECEQPPPAKTQTAHHHLAGRALDLAARLQRSARAAGLLQTGQRPPREPDGPVSNAVSATLLFASQLATALDGIVHGFDPEPGFVIAMLKRSLEPLNDSLRACGESIGTHQTTPEVCGWLISARDDLFALRSEILDMMTDLRSEV